MSILEPPQCEARRTIAGPACVGAVDAVRLETTHGPVIGCVLHSAIAAYYLANEISAHRDEESLTRRAAELLITYAPTATTSRPTGATP